MTTVSTQIANSSAIPAWSGFVYQGKVALYHGIQLLIDNDQTASYLKVETLEDFVVHNAAGEVLSLHQVKTMQSNLRSSYNSALKQAAKINTRDCTLNTIRWFHVSAQLNDFSVRAADISKGEYEVQFYQYHNGRSYIETGKIDKLLYEKVSSYLQSRGALSTERLIQHKIAKLQALLAARVNLAHHRNQHSKLTKFESADSVDIRLTEIEDCLLSQAIDESDQQAILFKFRHNLIERTDQILIYHERQGSNNKSLFSDVCACRYAIANMNETLLKKLYFSKDPSLEGVSFSGFSKHTAVRYMSIIATLKAILLRPGQLPYYHTQTNGKYLPTAMELGALDRGLSIEEIQTNIEGIRRNPVVQDILYDYDNLIVKMDDKPFRLCDEVGLVGKITDVGNQSSARLTKINNIRFISTNDAGDEIND